MIEAEHAQSELMRREAPPDDHWQPYAQQFAADPRRSDDPLLRRLFQEVKPEHTIIDVGAGAGRLALPLALHCQRVIAVEPSPSMASVLLRQAADYKIQNVSLVQAQWEDAAVDVADIVLCVHVLYTARDIELFVRKLEAHARERVMVVLFKTPPQAQIYSLWKRIHGEDRLPLPSLPEFQEVLRELGIEPSLEPLPEGDPRGFDSLEQATEQLTRRLYLPADGHKRSLLDNILPDVLEEVDGAFRVRGEKPLEPTLVWWEPNDLA